jgi:mono/diheme cytochrome c family protein
MIAPLAVAAAVVLTVGMAHAQTSPTAAVERGKYLVEVLAACGNCHTPKGPDGDIRAKHMAGGFTFDEIFGVAVSSNVTPDPETGIGAWTDAEITRAIREGKSRDGRVLGPPMPYYLYRRLSDNDVNAIVAYLRTLPPVKNAVTRSRYRFAPGASSTPLAPVPDPPKHDPVKYGEYLAGPVAHCADCHTPRGLDGRANPAKLFSGGVPFEGPWGTSYASNLTPDKETGIGAWTDAEIIAAIYGAKRDGRRLLPPMPTHYYATGIAGDDLRAIISYLRSLPPVRNKVPAAKPPAAR